MTQPHESVARAPVMNGWGEILDRQTLPGLAMTEFGFFQRGKFLKGNTSLEGDVSLKTKIQGTHCGV